MINEVKEFEYYINQKNFKDLHERLKNYNYNHFNHIAIILLRGYIYGTKEPYNHPWDNNGNAVINSEINIHIQKAIEKTQDWFISFIEFIENQKDKKDKFVFTENNKEIYCEKAKQFMDNKKIGINKDGKYNKNIVVPLTAIYTNPLSASEDKTFRIGRCVTEALKAGPLKSYAGFMFKKTSEITNSPLMKYQFNALCQLAYYKMVNDNPNKYTLIEERAIQFTMFATNGRNNSAYSYIYKELVESEFVSVISGNNYLKAKFSNVAFNSLTLLNSDELEKISKNHEGNIFQNDDYIVIVDNGINDIDKWKSEK